MKRWMASFCTAALLVAAMSAAPMTSSALAKGDINNDGRVDTLDVRLIMRGALGADTVTQKMIFVGDMSPDNKLSTADAQVLMRQVLTADTAEVEDADYAHPADTDCWGERSVSLIGDSISYGAWASDPLPENNYVSFVKKAVQKANGGNMNYGFVSTQDDIWAQDATTSTAYQVFEIHKVVSTGNWSSSETPDERLFSYGYTSTKAWDYLTYRLRSDYVGKYDYFCVYYQAMPGGGSFAIADGNNGEVANIHGDKNYVPTANSTSITKRTAFYPLADCPKDANGCPLIHICHGGNTNPVTITGIGYYKNTSPSTVTFNSYALSGESLSDVGNQVLTQAASADTLIMAMGYNDVYWNAAKVNSGVFRQKIDHLIQECNKNQTKVIVTDHVWDNTSKVGRNTAQEQAYQTVKQELRRLAKETGGIYIDQQGIGGTQLLNSLNSAAVQGKPGDGVHPNDAGHKMIAKNIVEAMGLEWTESWT